MFTSSRVTGFEPSAELPCSMRTTVFHRLSSLFPASWHAGSWCGSTPPSPWNGTDPVGLDSSSWINWSPVGFGKKGAQQMSCLTLPFFTIFHRLQDWPLTPGLVSEISPLTTDPGTCEASRPKTQPETPGMFSASRYHCSWGVLKSLSWILKFWRLNRTWMLFWTMRCNGRHYVDICCPCFRVPNLPFVGNILLHMGTFGTANHMSTVSCFR